MEKFTRSLSRLPKKQKGDSQKIKHIDYKKILKNLQEYKIPRIDYDYEEMDCIWKIVKLIGWETGSYPIYDVLPNHNLVFDNIGNLEQIVEEHKYAIARVLKYCNQWEEDDEFILGYLGKGAFGKAEAVIKNKKKLVKKTIYINSSISLQIAKNETNVLKKLLKIDNCNKLYCLDSYDYNEDKKEYYIYTRFIEDSFTLSKYFNNDCVKSFKTPCFYKNCPNKLSDKDKVNILKSLLEQVKLLHDNDIAHLDIKPDNILILHDKDNDRKYARLIDYGISCIDETCLSGGTRLFIHPYILQMKELVKNITLKQAKFGDVYSLGVLFVYINSNGQLNEAIINSFTHLAFVNYCIIENDINNTEKETNVNALLELFEDYKDTEILTSPKKTRYSMFSPSVKTFESYFGKMSNDKLNLNLNLEDINEVVNLDDINTKDLNSADTEYDYNSFIDKYDTTSESSSAKSSSIGVGSSDDESEYRSEL